MAAGPECVIGIDFGTLSGRAVVVRVEDGEELGTAVHEYANGVIDRSLPSDGARLPPQWALQDPEDWLDVLRRNPGLRYVSDGDPRTISFPASEEAQLAPSFRARANAY